MKMCVNREGTKIASLLWQPKEFFPLWLWLIPFPQSRLSQRYITSSFPPVLFFLLNYVHCSPQPSRPFPLSFVVFVRAGFVLSPLLFILSFLTVPVPNSSHTKLSSTPSGSSKRNTKKIVKNAFFPRHRYPHHPCLYRLCGKHPSQSR
jgi:hypothetical protein